MKKQKSLNKCGDRYALVVKEDQKYITRGKVFNQNIVITTPNMSYEQVKHINEEIFKNAKYYEDINVQESKNFISWLSSYIKKIGNSIDVTLSGQPILA